MEEFVGFWWHPSTPEKRFKGKYSFSVEGKGVLVIDGWFDAGSLRVDRILGTTKTGEDVTLDSCYIASMPISPDHLSTTSIIVNYAFIGAHFEEEILFDEVYTEFILLHDWVGVSGFNMNLFRESEGHRIEYDFPDSIPFYSDEFCKFS